MDYCAKANIGREQIRGNWMGNWINRRRLKLNRILFKMITLSFSFFIWCVILVGCFPRNNNFQTDAENVKHICICPWNRQVGFKKILDFCERENLTSEGHDFSPVIIFNAISESQDLDSKMSDISWIRNLKSKIWNPKC